MPHSVWSSTCCRLCRSDMDRRKHSLRCATGSPIDVARRDLSPVTGTMSQATMTNGINRLPCGYLYPSSHWIAKSMSGCRPCRRQRGGRLMMVHWFLTSWSPLWINTTQNVQNKNYKWLTVTGWSKSLANIHTHECNEVTLVRGSLWLTPINHLAASLLLSVHASPHTWHYNCNQWATVNNRKTKWLRGEFLHNYYMLESVHNGNDNSIVRIFIGLFCELWSFFMWNNFSPTRSVITSGNCTPGSRS